METAKNGDGLEYCIVRCTRAGVHSGFVAKKESTLAGVEVTLLQTRRLWKWYGRTLSGLALEGTLDASKCKFSPEIPKNIVLDACEIISCTEAGMESLRGVPEWVNN